MRNRQDIRGFLSADTGQVAILFGLLAVILIGLAGFAVDLSRAYLVQADLQGIADAAALAGAVKDKDPASISTANVFAASQLTSARTFGSKPLATATIPATDEVRVTISANVGATISSIIRKSYPVTVSATAHRGDLVRKVTISVNNFNADAADLNEIYVYAIPTDGSTPDVSKMTKILSNDPKADLADVENATAYVDPDEGVGFALHNVTGGVSIYGKNQYGGAPGSSHWFYSQKTPENLSSAAAGGRPNSSCTYSPKTVSWTCTTGGRHPTTTVVHVPQSFGDCKSVTVNHFWDDNGGSVDDNDYNDATYSYSCAETVHDPDGVRLIS